MTSAEQQPLMKPAPKSRHSAKKVVIVIALLVVALLLLAISATKGDVYDTENGLDPA